MQPVILMSVAHLEKRNIFIDSRKNILIDHNNNNLCELASIGAYKCIPILCIRKFNQYSILQTTVHKFDLRFLHNLFGHINVKSIKKSIDAGMIKNIESKNVDWLNINSFQCKYCLLGKTTRHRHTVRSRLKYQKEYQPFEYIHSDLFEPVSGISAVQPSYFISFSDECTRFRWVFPLRHKNANSVHKVFKTLINMKHTQFNTKLLSFQMDNGTEYNNSILQDLFIEKGIICIFNTPADSASNGVAKKANLTFLNNCKTLLQLSNFPASYWFHAVEYSTLIRNAFFNSSIEKSAIAKASAAGLDASTILPFGQEAVVHNHNTDSKLEEHGLSGYALCSSKSSHK